MTDITDERIAKLPQWARALIESMARSVAQQAQIIADLKDGPADSDTFVSPGAAVVQKGDVPMPLKRGTEIEFRLGDGWGEQLSVRARTLETGMRVLEVRGERRMAQRSMSSNVIHFFALPLEDA